MPDESQAGRGAEGPGTGPAEEPLRELTLGRPRPSPDPPSHGTPQAMPDDDIGGLAAVCRAKAEAARWAAERLRRLRERDESPDEDAPSDVELRQWAERLTDAFYWASADDASGSPDITVLDDVGGCFEALAEALLLAHATGARRAGPEKALPLLAEAQSMLRRAFQRLQAPDDPDQLAAYEAVREEAARHRVFLKRFLRADDLADPEGWPGLLARIERQAGGGARCQGHERLLDRLRTQVRSLGEGGAAELSWRSVIEAVEEAVAGGVPPSSRAVRGLLSPYLDEVPEGAELTPGFRLVLREIDRYLATRQPRIGETASPEPTIEVREAARLLSGRSAVLIGGLRRSQAQESLRAALGLEELIWIGTREHQSIRGFEAAIARPEVAVVLLAIRWSGHAFGDVKQYCDRYGKPLVRLPGGYNPAQVAAQILAQCGERFRAGTSPS